MLAVEAEEGSSENPASTVSSFFRNDFKISCDSVVMDISIARSISPTLCGASMVDPGLVARYIEGWKAVGFFNASTVRSQQKT